MPQDCAACSHWAEQQCLGNCVDAEIAVVGYKLIPKNTTYFRLLCTDSVCSIGPENSLQREEDPGSPPCLK